MKRLYTAPRPAWVSLSGAFHQQPRRTFASPPIKDSKPPAPIERFQEQVHPIGAFYESIMRTPQPISEVTREVMPTTADSEAAPPPPELPPNKPQAEIKKFELDSEALAPEKKTAVPVSARRGRPPKQPKEEANSKANTRAQIQRKPNLDPEQRPSDGLGGVTFSPSVAGPAPRAAERREARSARGHLGSGVLVPPRPEEPGNCCMSGCVNCVWDLYRDEMEEWAAKNAQAVRRERAIETGCVVLANTNKRKLPGATTGPGLGRYVVNEQGTGSMDRGDGESAINRNKNCSETKQNVFCDEELYKNVPVGICEFMKHEKRLKERHLKEGAWGH